MRRRRRSNLYDVRTSLRLSVALWPYSRRVRGRTTRYRERSRGHEWRRERTRIIGRTPAYPAF